jgi:L-ascorbate metabolism protein UlaG (beta-lactamase superfamily)
MRLTWLGHSSVVIDTGGARLLTDPVLRSRIGPLVRVAPPFEPGAADRVDAVLLSHLHADHAHLPSLRQVAAGIPVIAPRGAGAWLDERGIGDVRELAPGEATTVAGQLVTATPAEHGSRRRPFGHSADPVGFVVRGERSVYFAGDTDLFPGMADAVGSVDVALLPVWGWGPALGPGHLDPARAAEAAAIIAPRLAIPIHWGTFALPWLARAGVDRAPAREFAAQVAARAPAVEVRVLEPGGSESSVLEDAGRSGPPGDLRG